MNTHGYQENLSRWYALSAILLIGTLKNQKRRNQPLPQTKQEPKPVHDHSWFYRPNDISCERCQCGNIRVSEQEYHRRIDEWRNYFELARTTESYADYRKTADLFKSIKGMGKITPDQKARFKEIGDRALARLEKDEYLPKPSFPDPETWNGYVIK